MVVLLIRLILGGILSATPSGTCADIVSVTHLTGLPASVTRSGQVGICRANWLGRHNSCVFFVFIVAPRTCTAGLVFLLKLTHCD